MTSAVATWTSWSSVATWSFPRAPLIPRDDPTTLFTGSGMQPLLPYLLGAEHPAGHRLTDSQTCLRAQDIEEVGDNRHTTFFEMLGNWSLGDYFKREQLPMIWQFLTERVGLDPNRIYVSCFSGDEANGIAKDTESADIWVDLFSAAGVSADQVDLGTEEHGGEVGNGGARIAFYGSKNWWCRGGKAEDMPVGEPGGPDSEMFYLFPQVEHDPAFGAQCHQNCDCGRYLEIGNSVFMEFVKTETGFAPLPRTQRRLRRRARPHLRGVHGQSRRVPDQPAVAGRRAPAEGDRCDVRGAHGGDAGGCRPPARRDVPCRRRSRAQQQGPGYVMRRLVRRAIRFAFELGLDQDFFPDMVPVVAGMYIADYPEVGENLARVVGVLVKEEKVFRKTLRKGLKQLSTFAKAGPLGGAELFTLYDTFGFPVELSTEEARTQGISLTDAWREEFDDRMTQQRTRSQAASVMKP